MEPDEGSPLAGMQNVLKNSSARSVFQEAHFALWAWAWHAHQPAILAHEVKILSPRVVNDTSLTLKPALSSLVAHHRAK
jgi:hypothetical protein